ncbi:MAG: hypothetical protein ACYDCS_08200 [Candidatus Dormibacteria bacterium]
MDAAFGVDSWYGHKLAVLASREGKHEVPVGRHVVAESSERAAAVGLDRERIATLLGRERTPERGLDVADVRQLVDRRNVVKLGPLNEDAAEQLVRLAAGRCGWWRMPPRRPRRRSPLR